MQMDDGGAEFFAEDNERWRNRGKDPQRPYIDFGKKRENARAWEEHEMRVAEAAARKVRWVVGALGAAVGLYALVRSVKRTPKVE